MMEINGVWFSCWEAASRGTTYMDGSFDVDTLVLPDQEVDYVGRCVPCSPHGLMFYGKAEVRGFEGTPAEHLSKLKELTGMAYAWAEE